MPTEKNECWVRKQNGTEKFDGTTKKQLARSRPRVRKEIDNATSTLPTFCNGLVHLFFRFFESNGKAVFVKRVFGHRHGLFQLREDQREQTVAAVHLTKQKQQLRNIVGNTPWLCAAVLAQPVAQAL